MIIWKQDYELGINEIDDQHKVLVELINRLYDAFIKKEQNSEVIKVISELYNYTDTHFKTEEKYFWRFQYENTEKHIAEHKKFIDAINSFREQVEEDPGRFVFAIIKFLQDWILNHIMISDKEYVQCFKRNDVF